ncbi:galactose-1-phosphate uridylyltransferase [Bradyrhizobium cenepequi]
MASADVQPSGTTIRARIGTMSELRRDPTTDSWVLIAPERNRRPRDRRHTSEKTVRTLCFDPACPFCPGNESKLPGIIAEMPSSFQPGWRTRVVPNKFPAVGQDVAPCTQGPAFYKTAAGHGHHEVIIESPRHDHDLTTMPEDGVRDVLATCRSRYAVLMTERAVRAVIVFRNRGIAAGASLWHPHSQMIALETVPPRMQAWQVAMLSYYQARDRCVLCDVIAYEQGDGSRVVNENGAFVTVVPFAATAPCEMWLLPKRHQADFGDLQNGEIELLAIALRDALVRLEATLDNPPYNYVIDTAANSESGAPHLHWRLRIVPQLTVPAGFELASGMSINPSLPEQDAVTLRSFRQVLRETGA